MPKVTIDTVEKVFEGILVYFSDGKVTLVNADDLYRSSITQRSLLRRISTDAVEFRLE